MIQSQRHRKKESETMEEALNVNKEADAAFMRELERTDPVRHANLVRHMAHAAGAASLAQRKATAHRGGRPKKHKDKAAKQRVYRNRTRIVLTVTKLVAGPFIPMELQTRIQASATTIA
jgi:hypothetical protein